MPQARCRNSNSVAVPVSKIVGVASFKLKMTRLRCSALVFDLDGVLIDSTPAVARVWRRWAEEHGLNPEEVIAHAHGRPSVATIREFLPGADAEAENSVVEGREIEDLEGVVPLPGALELLRKLPADHWTIVTSGTRALAETRIRAAGLPLPEKMITADDIIHGKPDPEPYLKGIASLGFPADECVVLEDAPAGIEAGKAAGAKVIAFRTTAKESLLRAAGADWIVNNCGDIDVQVAVPAKADAAKGHEPDLTLTIGQ